MYTSYEHLEHFVLFERTLIGAELLNYLMVVASPHYLEYRTKRFII